MFRYEQPLPRKVMRMTFTSSFEDQMVREYMRRFPDGLPDGGSVTLCGAGQVQRRIVGPKTRDEMEQWVRKYVDLLIFEGESPGR